MAKNNKDYSKIQVVICKVQKDIQLRHINHCYKADPAYGQGVANALGIALSEVEAASAKNE